MKEKAEKKCSLFYSFYDRTRIVDFLEKQAAKGWLLDRTTSIGGWHFHRIDPKQIRFSVVYMKSVSMFDPDETDAQRTLADYCAHDGWTFAASNAQMQIFYSEDPDAAPIVTDAAVEIASIHAVMKKTYLPLYWMMIVLCFVNIVTALLTFVFDPVGWLSSSTELLVIVCWCLIGFMNGAHLIEYASWRHRAKKAASLDGSFIRTEGLRFFSMYSALLACLALILTFSFSIGKRGVDIGLGVVLWIVFGVFAIMTLSGLFRRLKYTRWLNRVLTVGLLVLLTVGVSAGVIAQIVEEDRDSPNDGNVEIYVSEISGFKQEIYHDELPLTVADLTGTDYEQDSKEIRLRGTSLLARCMCAREDARLHDFDQPELKYTVVAFRTPIGYRACRALMLRDFSYDDPDFAAVETDAAPWGADEAYQLKCVYEEQPRLDYFLCYGNTIVEICFNNGWEEEPTDAQKAIVKEKLGGYGQTKKTNKQLC